MKRSYIAKIMVLFMLPMCVNTTVFGDSEGLNFFKPTLLTKPTETKMKTQVQPIEKFTPSIPDDEAMTLRIKSFDIADKAVKDSVELLYAKGYIDDVDVSDYNEKKEINAEDFVAVLAKSLHLEDNFFETADKVISKKSAAVLVSNGMEHYRKMYHFTDKQKKGYEAAYIDLKGFSDSELEAICNVIYAKIIPAASEHEFGVNANVTYADAAVMIKKMLLLTDLIALGKGANMPFTEYETEYCETTGTNIVSDGFVDGFAYEALGRTTTMLSSTNQYIKFKNVPKSNRISIRYSIVNPKLKLESNGNVTEGGSDYSADLGVYVNGKKNQDVTLTARPLFGQRDTTSGAGQYNKKYYNMAYITNIDLKEGDEFVIKKDLTNKGYAYYIDSVYFEQAEEIVEKPEGFLDITDYGAVPNDKYDDTVAITKCLYDAEYKSKGVYFPAGEFMVSEMIFVGSNITIQGAGMHYTTLRCDTDSKGYWQFGGRGGFGAYGDNITIRDLRIYNTAQYVRSFTTVGITNRTLGDNWLFENLILENMQGGLWIACINSTIRNIRTIHTFADAIHFTNKSVNNIVENCYSLGCGDDGLAITGDGPPDIAHNIIWRNNTIRQTYWGRGIMVSGAYDVSIENNLVTDACHGPGLLIWTEKYYDSYSAYRVNVKGNTLLRCGSHGGNNAAMKQSNEHAGFYTDADIYSNEVYETIGDDAFSTFERDGKIYNETKNNIFQEPKAEAYKAMVRPVPNADSEVHIGLNLVIGR